MKLGPAITKGDMFAYRTAIHEATGYTTFYVMFGRSPLLPIDVMLGIHR